MWRRCATYVPVRQDSNPSDQAAVSQSLPWARGWRAASGRRFPGTVLSSTISPTLDNAENQYQARPRIHLHVASSVKRANKCPGDVCRGRLRHRRCPAYSRLTYSARSQAAGSQRSIPGAAAQARLQRSPVLSLPNAPASDADGSDLMRILELKDAALLYEYWCLCRYAERSKVTAGRRLGGAQCCCQ